MANKVYDNFVLESKIDNMLTTAIDINNYLTPDYSLTESAGMKKTVNVYNATGDVEDVAQGVGNSGDIAVTFTPKEYTVGTTQGRFPYFDEEVMKDPMVIDTGLKAIAEKMTNDLTDKAVKAMASTELTKQISWNFNDIVDAIAMLNVEDEAGLFLMINPAEKAKLRKNLGQDLKYVEDFSRKGYIGHVCGVPVIVSKAVTAGEGYLATKDAVTCFVKKGVEIEQERDANLRKNVVYGRKVMLVALTNGTKCVKLTSAA